MKRHEHSKVQVRALPLAALEAFERFGEAGVRRGVKPVVVTPGVLKSREHAGSEGTGHATRSEHFGGRCDRCGLYYQPSCLRCVGRRLARRHGASEASQRERGSGRPGLAPAAGASPTRRAPGAGDRQGRNARRMKVLRGLKPRAQRAARQDGTS